MEDATFGGKMELLKLSRFKFQLQTLISEVVDLRESERSKSEQLHLAIQKQKQNEEELGSKLKELESELASSVELQQKIQRKVAYLQNDNSLLEGKQKELSVTIQALLQSREHFVNSYQDSTCELKRSVETRDRKLKVFTEKLRSHILLFDSIEKEALAVKQAVDNVRLLVCDKEDIVSGLKRKLDKVSEVEKVFIGKTNEMEIQLGKYKDEVKRKDKIILELEAKLEAENTHNKNQAQMEERALSMKEVVIRNLILEKEALDSEVKSLGATLEKIQHAVGNMREDEKAFQTILQSKEISCSIFPDKTDKEFHDEEPACSTTQLACSGSQSPTNAQTMSTNEGKSNCTITVNQFESENATTQADASEHPD